MREDAERIVNDLDQTLHQFKQATLDGTVCVGIPDDYGSDVLPGILSDFARLHPTCVATDALAFTRTMRTTR